MFCNVQESAKDAYWICNDLFAKRELETLQPMVSQKLLDAFRCVGRLQTPCSLRLSAKGSTAFSQRPLLRHAGGCDLITSLDVETCHALALVAVLTVFHSHCVGSHTTSTSRRGEDCYVINDLYAML